MKGILVSLLAIATGVIAAQAVSNLTGLKVSTS